MGIDLEIEEGDKYYIRNVSWVGNSQYSTELLQRMFGVSTRAIPTTKRRCTNGWASARKPIPKKCRVSSLYQNNGYLMSQSSNLPKS